jgi:uncharacterized protein YndB with AHSA1/START domain
VKLVDTTLRIEAPPELVFEMLTQAEHLVRWLAPAAEVDARPGGSIRWTHANGDTCSGWFVDLVPGRRVVFTYGWERADVEMPPGSTTVEITLIPRGTSTELHLVHRGLAGPMADAYAGGWDNYLRRLALAAERGDPGPDPLADERVPSAAELYRP